MRAGAATGMVRPRITGWGEERYKELGAVESTRGHGMIELVDNDLMDSIEDAIFDSIQ